MTGRPRKNYCLYKGDEFIAEGDLHKISEITGKKVKTLLIYNTPTYINRCKKRERKYENTYFLVEIVDE